MPPALRKSPLRVNNVGVGFADEGRVYPSKLTIALIGRTVSEVPTADVGERANLVCVGAYAIPVFFHPDHDTVIIPPNYPPIRFRRLRALAYPKRY